LAFQEAVGDLHQGEGVVHHQGVEVGEERHQEEVGEVELHQGEVEEEELHQGGVGEVEYPLGVEEVPLLGGVGEVVFHQGVVVAVELLQVEGVVVVPHQGVGVGEVHLLVVLEVVVILVLMTKDEYC
jgi:hypothetical protein